MKKHLRKIVSTLLLLTMLLSQATMIVSAQGDATDALKNKKLVCLNTSATSIVNLLVNTNGEQLLGWPEGSLTIETEKNVSGTEFKSVKSEDTKHWFLGGDSNGTPPKFITDVLNQPKTTYELWVKTDNIGTGENERKNIFYTGTDNNYTSQYATGEHGHGKQSLFVRNGKLVYDVVVNKNAVVVGEYDLSKKKGKYVHVVLTKELDATDSENPTIKYIAYFDGEKVGEYTKTEDIDIEKPDGTLFFFGGFFDTTGDKRLQNDRKNNFDGNIASFNIYSDVANQDTITELYNENKELYTMPEPFENSKLMSLNKSATSFGNLTVDENGNTLENWAQGTLNIEEETNLSEKTFKSVKSVNTSPWFAAIGGNEDAFRQKILNKAETTYEFWVKTTDIGTDSSARKNIFYTGDGMNYASQYATGKEGHGKQSLFVRNGKLVYDVVENKNSVVVGEYNLSEKKGKYVHVVLTRKLDTTDSEKPTIKYIAYFDGVKAGEYTKETDIDATSPDGQYFFFGGFFDTTDDKRLWADSDNLFAGNIAEFNIYGSIASQSDVTERYNENKNTYDVEVVEENVEPIVAFKKAKKLELNKNATTVSNLPVIPGTTSAFSNWPGGDNDLKIDEETNVSGETFKSVKFSNDKTIFIGADENSNATFWSTNLNHQKTTWEFWLKTDDIDRGNKWKKNIFYTGTGFTFTHYFVRDVKQALYIQDGKLIYGTNNKEIASVDLGDYQSKYVHAIIAREVDENNGTIKYVAYFNGKKSGEYTKTKDVDITAPDGNKVFFGGIYFGDIKATEKMRFSGNIAEYNVYHDMVTDEIAQTLYEENKDTYCLYAQLEDFYPSGNLKDNTITFNFDSKMDDKTFENGFIVKMGETTLTYGKDYKIEAVGKDAKITILNLNKSASYSVELTDSLKSSGGAKVYMEEGEEYIFEFGSFDNTVTSVKNQLASIDDFTKDNVKTLKAFKERILPLENLGVDFTNATNYDKYCEIKENISAIKTAVSSYKDDKLYINVEFEYPVSEETANKIKYFVGRKENTKREITFTKNGDGKVVSAKITDDNLYKDSDYVQITAYENWIGQETKNFYVPTAVSVKDITIKDSSNNKKDSLFEITDKKADIYVTVTNNSYEDGISGDVIISVKDEKGMLKDVKVVPKTLEQGVDEEVFATFENIPQNAKNYSVEAYFWNTTAGMSPYTEKKDYTKTYGIDNVNDIKKDITVAAIGGSITEGGNITTPFINSWREAREGKINFINAGIGGTQSNYGSLRLQNDVLSKKPDVVIVEFILNDIGDETCAWNVENIIRACYEAEHQPVVIFLYVPDRRMSGTVYARVENYNRYKPVMEAYGLTPLDAHGMAVANVENGTDWDTYVSSNNVHPDKEQGANIASLMWNELSNNMSTYIKNIEYTDKMCYRPGIENGKRVSASMISYSEDWAEKTPDNLVTEGYGNAAVMRSDKYVATKKAGAKLSFEFSGTKLMLTTIVGNTGRSANYVIKDKDGNIETQGTLSNYVNLTPFENLMFDLNATSGDQYMELNLKNGMHTIEITVLESDNENSEFGIADILIDEN